MSEFKTALSKIRTDLAKAMPGGERALHKAMTADGPQAHTRPRTMSSEAFMAKAMSANRARLISSAEMYQIESSISDGRQPPAELVKAVLLETPVALRGEHGATFARLQANWPHDPMTKAQASEYLSGQQFMAKALSAQAAGRLTGTEVAECEAYVNSGREPRQELVSKVLEVVA